MTSNDPLGFEDLFPWADIRQTLVRSRTFWLLVANAIQSVMLFASGRDYQLLFGATAGVLLTVYLLVLKSFLRSDISLWTILAVFVLVYLLMELPLIKDTDGDREPLLYSWLWIWRNFIPSESWTAGDGPFPWYVQFASNFFAAGVAEDTFKVLPAVAAIGAGAWLTRMNPRPAWAERLRKVVDLSRPSTLLMVCLTSAAAFVYVETVGQYVHKEMLETGVQALNALKSSDLSDPDKLLLAQNFGAMHGMQLLLPRVLGFLTGHGAYAGIVGYGLILARLRPRQAVLAVGSAVLVSATLHAAWDTFDQSVLLIPLAFAAGYALLGVCLRVISLDQELNFEAAIPFGGSITPPAKPAGQPAVVYSVARKEEQQVLPPVAPPALAPARTSRAVQSATAGTLTVEGHGILPSTVPLAAGSSLDLGLALPEITDVSGVRLSIVTDPAKPGHYGMKNLGEMPWVATLADGRTGNVITGQAVVLSAGLVLRIGDAVLRFSPV